MPYNLIVIGCSLGGLQALQSLLAGIAQVTQTPIVIVQHRDREVQTGGMLAYILQRASRRRVEEAEDKMPIAQNKIYLAPADYHLLVEDDRFILSTELPVAHARPSIDVMFESAARSYGASLVGIVLTGTGSDGAEGLAQIERRGGLVIVEDPKTAEQPAMPCAAISRTKSPTILSLKSIAPFLCSLEITGEGDAARASS